QSTIAASPLQTAPNVAFALLPNQTYTFKFWVVFRSSVATNGFRLSLTFPTVSRFAASVTIPQSADGTIADWRGFITPSGDAGARLDFDDREGLPMPRQCSEPRGEVCLPPRLQSAESRRTVHLRIPFEDEVPRRGRGKALLAEPALQAALEHDLEGGHAVDVGIRVEGLVHVDRLQSGAPFFGGPDRLGEARRGLHRRLP